MSSSEVEAARSFADEQLNLQEAAEGDENEMAGLYAAPSVGQGYLLVTDRFGVAKLDQDSSFICSRIQFASTKAFSGSGSAVSFSAATKLGFSVRDAGSSILVTISKWRQGLPNGGPIPIDMDTISESQFACTAALVPQGRDTSEPLGQVDYVYTLSARWQIPRGSTIRTAFAEMPANGLTPAGAVIRQHRPQLLFVGRKVFG